MQKYIEEGLVQANERCAWVKIFAGTFMHYVHTHTFAQHTYSYYKYSITNLNPIFKETCMHILTYYSRTNAAANGKLS